LSSAHIPDGAEIPDPFLEEVSPGIYAYIQLDGSWGLNNAGFIVGEDAVTVIDSCFNEKRARAYNDVIAGVTSLPIRTLVNTHHHGDHTNGNYLSPQATIIGHEQCRQWMIDTAVSSNRHAGLFPNVDWGDIKIAPPFVTFEDRLNIYVGDLKVEAIYVGPAHTTNDVILWIPERKLLFAGDIIFNGGTPFVSMGSVAGMLVALEQIRALGAEKIVPGHGLVCGAEQIDEQVAYLRFIQEVARKGFDAGKTPLEAATAADLGRFAALLDAERLVGNLHRAYSEIRGEPLGTTLDLPMVVADMITLNGGKPVRCVA
jgi:cyclase